MHYYSFNIADYRKDTAHLTPTEHYIYRQLIDWCYLDECGIPKKTQSVIRRLSLVSSDAESLQNVLDDFFEEREDEWVHLRIEQDIVEYHEKTKTNRKNGKKGGRPRKQGVENIGTENNNPEKTQSVNFANPTESESNPNQELLTNNQYKTYVKAKACDMNNPDPNQPKKPEAEVIQIKKPKESGAPNCPHEEIIELYHSTLPELQRVAVWSDKRAKLLRSRWNENEAHQSLEFWRSYFEHVKQSDFLLGKASGTAWRASLEWLINSSNFIKVIEGQYHTGGAA